jgi:FKBP-type peptidyl-prolyl cis-trans isomerase
VKANYKGMLMSDGTVFEQGPLEYPLSNLIQGWQIGFQKLQRGGKATLYIPSSLAYGINGSPPKIPSNANLIFEVELIDFK